MSEGANQKSYEQGKFEGQVLQRLDDLNTKLADYHEKHTGFEVSAIKLESRVRKLENFRSWILGAVASSGGLGGALGAYLSQFFK